VILPRLFKWGLGIIGVLAICAAVAGSLFFMMLTWTVPNPDGMMRLAGLQQEVLVVRDAEAIPHIQAATHEDAARALGFVHAQDRLWQMQVLRMAGQGRLSEMFGKATVETDIFLRTLDMASPARKAFEILKPETKAVMIAYAQGVNAFVGRKTKMFHPKLPPEFLVLGVTPEPWEPWQSGLILKVMALTLGKNMGTEIQRLALAARGFSPKKTQELIPYGPRDNPPDLPDLRGMYGIGENIKTKARVGGANGIEKSAGLAFDIGVSASNNWVISGSRTKSGKPILANDPHLGLTAPAIFYLAHLSFKEDGREINIIGGTLPGTPLVLAGRNDEIAWGLTTTNLDAQDLFVERLDPEDPDQYLTPHGYKKFETDEVVIKVSGGADVKLIRRKTRHGPVLPGEYKNLKKILPLGHVAALSWVALDPNDTTLDAVTAMAKARTVSQFISAMKGTVSPMQSIVVGDVEGNIGMIAPGRAPIRDPDNEIAGRAPSPGWMAKYDWKGFLPFEQLPQQQNPQSGAIATANANFLPPSYKQHITFDWGEHFRQARVEQRIVNANNVHDIAHTLDVISDIVSPAMLKLRDAAIDLVPNGVSFDRAMMDALKNWDGKMDKASPEPLLMISWFKHLHKGMFADELDDIYDLFERGKATPLINLLEKPRSHDWCEDQTTPQSESCSDLAILSLKSAVAELKEKFGSNWEKWRWGAAHKAYGEHRPFAKVGPLAAFFNIEVESSGGPYTLRRGQTDFGKEDPYLSRHASVYRAIYDFADLEKSMFIQSTGQSGHFRSDYYRNFAERWADMKFVPMVTKPENYEKQAIGTWRLTP